MVGCIRQERDIGIGGVTNATPTLTSGAGLRAWPGTKGGVSAASLAFTAEDRARAADATFQRLADKRPGESREGIAFALQLARDTVRDRPDSDPAWQPD